jgi:hypothetical protein
VRALQCEGLSLEVGTRARPSGAGSFGAVGDSCGPEWRQQDGAIQENDPCGAASRVRVALSGTVPWRSRLHGRQLLLDEVPQVLEYERTADLELWELRL